MVKKENDMENKFVIEDDKLYQLKPLPQYGENVSEKVLIIDKATFIELFNKWIKPEIN